MLFVRLFDQALEFDPVLQAMFIRRVVSRNWLAGGFISAFRFQFPRFHRNTLTPLLA